MGTYVLKRLLLMIPTLVGISLVLWVVMVSAPGRPGGKAQEFGAQDPSVDPTKELGKGEAEAIFRRHFALDRPVFWNSWPSLGKDEVARAVETAAADLNVVGAKAKRTARESLEDWGAYSVPALVDLLDEREGAAQDAVLYWLRRNSTWRPKAQGQALSEAERAEVQRMQAENARLALLSWRSSDPPERRAAVVADWRKWFDENRGRWSWSFVERAKVGITDTQFGTYWGNLLRLDLGESHVYRRPVIDLILERLPISCGLAFVSILLVYALAIPLGIFSAIRPYGAADRVLTVVLFLLYSLPTFFVGTILLRALTVGDPYAWFPTSGLRDPDLAWADTWTQWRDVLWHVTLPLVVLTYGGLAQLSRYTRTGMLDVIRSDYVRTARAKGLPESSVILRHAARNGMMPVVTLLGGVLPALIGGSIVVEYIFNIKGMGVLALDAITNKDYNIVAGETLIVAVLVQVGILLSDVLYAVLDPRISYS